MKQLGLIFLSVALSATAYGQTNKNEYEDEKWVLKGITGLNLSQTAVSNWASGGENSFAGNAYLNGTLAHKSGKWLWINTLGLDYGLTKTKSQGVQKTSDKIAFATQLGYQASEKWYYTAMADLNTQFYKGYNYPDKSHYISKFFAPAYSNISLGMDYRLNNEYSIYLSPAAGKLTFVEDDYLSGEGAFGVNPGDRFKAEIGAYIKAKAEQKIMENVNLITSLDLFTPYDNQFGNVDVNWDILINMKINKFLSATLNTTLKYDNDVKTFNDEGKKQGAKVQFKEVLGIGVAYNF